MNYQIITDEQELLKFIDWLPELEQSETFYCCLFARSKYCKGIAHVRSDKAQLKRFTSDKKRLFNKIKQLECPVGSHTMKEVGTDKQIPVPQEALALYITINPRCFKKANTASVRKLLDLALQPYNGFHPYQEVMSEIQKAKSRTEFITFDFDVDKKDWPYIAPLLNKAMNTEAYSIVETRGGFHVIVRPAAIAAERKKKWYTDMRMILANVSSDHDNAGDIMLPVPGTYQGGFTPHFIKI